MKKPLNIVRTAVFIDFNSVQVNFNNHASATRPNVRARIDWPSLAGKCIEIANGQMVSDEYFAPGSHLMLSHSFLYTSYLKGDERFTNWIESRLRGHRNTTIRIEERTPATPQCNKERKWRVCHGCAHSHFCSMGTELKEQLVDDLLVGLRSGLFEAAVILTFDKKYEPYLRSLKSHVNAPMVICQLNKSNRCLADAVTHHFDVTEDFWDLSLMSAQPGLERSFA